jgi:chromosome partitioning protein
MIKLTTISLSGGQGKTTLSLFLARSLIAKGVRTLLIDLDPLGDFSQWLGFSLQSGQATLLDVLQGRINVQEAIYPVLASEHCGLLRGASELGVSRKAKKAQMPLWQALEPLETAVDFCIIDTPPHAIALNEMALTSADWIVIPAEAGVKGYSSLIHTLNLISDLNVSRDKLLGVVPFRDRWIGSKQTQECRLAIAEMADEVGESLILPSIRESEVFKRAINQQVTLAQLGEPALEDVFETIVHRLAGNLTLPQAPNTPKKRRKKAKND